jgi:DNA-directed RNA polymerase specialized sigma24 family protein
MLRREDVVNALNALPRREREVIELRYGCSAASRARSRRSAGPSE